MASLTLPKSVCMSSESKSFIVEWYRPSQSRMITRIWIRSATAVLLGSMMLGLAFFSSLVLPSLAFYLCVTLGAFCVPAGPLYAAIHFHRILREERYVALRNDGLLFQHDEHATFIPWQELDVPDAIEENGETIELFHGASPVVLPLPAPGDSASRLARRIKDVQRKALMNLLRPR